MQTIDFANVLRWFTGKARVNAEAAIALLNASITAAGWVPKASVKVRAAFNKANVVIKAGRAARHILERMGRDGRYAYSEMAYGNYFGAQRVDWAALLVTASSAERDALTTGQQWAADMAPVATAIRHLDDTRPRPVFTSVGASPTVTKTLQYLLNSTSLEGMTVSVCPIRWEELTKVVNGKTIHYSIAHLEWPEGTVHHTSIHQMHGDRNLCCEACGHAIRNAYNWAPLVVSAPGLVPRSLWVGRDCAQTIFGVKVTGEVELAGGPDGAS